MSEVSLNTENEYPFSFAKMNKYYLFLFLVPIICYSTKFFSEVMKNPPDYSTTHKTCPNIDVERTFVFLYTIINSLSHLTGGLLFFISLLITKSDKNSKEKETTSLLNDNNTNSIRGNISNYLYSDDNDKFKKIKLRLIIVFMSFFLLIYIIIKGYSAGSHKLEK